MFCIFCGTELPNEAEFCWKCGKKVYRSNNVQKNRKPNVGNSSPKPRELVDVLSEEKVALMNEIVAYIMTLDRPVTAETINDKFVHDEKTNRASALLRRACENGLISRDKVRKNALYEYASVDFDWNEYITAYDNEMARKAQERIERARRGSR